jgi:O-acetylhomoserine (thiol)-lyase
MADRIFQSETLAIHAGQIPDSTTGARALPIYQTTSFVFDSADHAASLFTADFGNVYPGLRSDRGSARGAGRRARGRAPAGLGERHGGRGDHPVDPPEPGRDHALPRARLYGGTVSMLAVNPRSSAF